MSRLLLLLLISCCPYPGVAQTVQDNAQLLDEVKVSILKQVGSRCFIRSLKAFGPVVDEKTFLELTAEESPEGVHNRCGHLKDLKVDFNTQSLMTYRVSGDCFVRGNAYVTRNDATKTYTFHVTRIYGGCRAAGSYEGWLVVDKLLPDYRVEFVVNERDASGEERIKEDG